MRYEGYCRCEERVIYMLSCAGLAGCRCDQTKNEVEMIMSTNLNLAAAPGAAGHEASAPIGSRLTELLRGWKAAWREAMALRRTLHEISRLSDRELTDIGLAHDEILRLRSSETFMPRGWRHPEIGRSDLPF